MEVSELVTKQQIQIEELKILTSALKKKLEDISSFCVCIGGPLNDNKKMYTHAQRMDWHHINDLADIYHLTCEDE